MTEPTQKPGRSKQDYGTPSDFLAAVQRRFGAIEFDLAASAENAVCQNYYSAVDNALVSGWEFGGLVWINPPFADIAPWAERCAEYGAKGQKILMLTPASVGSNWFSEHVHGKAIVLALSPRLTFMGCKYPYPKDCILSCFGFGVSGFDVWRWK